MINVYRMVGRLMQLMQNSNFASGLSSGSKHGITEIVFRDNLRAAESEKDAPGLNSLKTFYIKAGIAFQRIAQSSPVLGKCRGVKNYEVIFSVICIKEFESIVTKSLMAPVSCEV